MISPPALVSAGWAFIVALTQLSIKLFMMHQLRRWAGRRRKVFHPEIIQLESLAERKVFDIEGTLLSASSTKAFAPKRAAKSKSLLGIIGTASRICIRFIFINIWMSMLRVVNLLNRYEYLLQARFYFHLDTARREKKIVAWESECDGVLRT